MKQFKNKSGAAERYRLTGAWGSNRKADQNPTKSPKYPQKQKRPYGDNRHEPSRPDNDSNKYNKRNTPYTGNKRV